jgi:methylmalonyl-CoA/ethylmalonyl-CoA epimerase
MNERTDLRNATVGQLLIPVRDLPRAIEFYRDTLGVPFLFEAPPQMSFFQAGSVRLLVGVPEPASAGAGSVVYFKVEDIHAVHRTLVERGVPFSAEPHRVHRTATYELWLAELSDPDGNALALMAEVAVEA